ncbi:hypothetical protein [Micromonospora sp. NPDC050200]|uniref:hypothetical protein n=1 Tax=Micromonospora sp. NPDC050200 TaxID=3155664 RepID=UPI003406BF4D
MLTRRLEHRVRSDFWPSEAETILELLAALQLPFLERSAEETERVQAAVVLLAGGDSRRFLIAAAEAEQDWRDVLVEAGLAEEDWLDRLSAALG